MSPIVQVGVGPKMKKTPVHLLAEVFVVSKSTELTPSSSTENFNPSPRIACWDYNVNLR